MLRLSGGYLAGHGSDSARLDAELLIAHSLGLRRLDLYLQHDRPLDDEELLPIRALLRRRAAGEPVAYLTGVREFYGRAFEVSAEVLIPRPDTETLVQRALRRAGEIGGAVQIADLGSGSGCIAVTLACELPDARIEAVEVSAGAAAVAQANAARHGVGDRVTVHQGSWGQPLAGMTVAMLVSNPPYIETGEIAGLMRDVRDFEPRLALDGGVDGLDGARAVLEAAAGLVEPGGWIAIEVDPRRAEALAGLIAERWPAARPVLVDDLTGRPRVVEATLPR